MIETHAPIPLRDLARVVRSKNAGPTLLTLDVFFKDAVAYARAASSDALAPQTVSQTYGVPAQAVVRHLLPQLCAIKFTLPRLRTAGEPGDGDIYGAQQHAPLLELML